MTTQSEYRPWPLLDHVDAQITASIKGLAASMDIKAEELAELVGVHRTTWYRRKRNGGWTATEVAAIAARCGVSVEDIYSGRATVVIGPDDDPDNTKLPRLDSNQQPAGNNVVELLVAA